MCCATLRCPCWSSVSRPCRAIVIKKPVPRNGLFLMTASRPRQACTNRPVVRQCLGCVCKPSSRNRVTTGKCATMTSLKTSGSGLSPYCQQKVLLVEGDRLVTSETFSMLYIGCCEPDLHGELCQRNMVRGKPYIPDSGVGRKEDIWLLSLSFLPYRLTWTTS